MWDAGRVAVFERMGRGLTLLRSVAGGTPAFQSVDVRSPAFNLLRLLHPEKIYPRGFLPDIDGRDRF